LNFHIHLLIYGKKMKAYLKGLISEGSRDTENWSNGAENVALQK